MIELTLWRQRGRRRRIAASSFSFLGKKMFSFNLILEIVVRKWKMKNEIVSELPKWKRKFCETEILGIG